MFIREWKDCVSKTAMKMRLAKNSIRLRLLQNEVRRLREIGRISETIDFGVGTNEKLTYSLRNSAEASDVFVQFADNQIEVVLPVKMVEDWADTDEVGLYAEHALGDITHLKIIVEKDFVCLDRPKDADYKDAFPHPKTKC